jgi:hypothetical protein
VKDSDARMAFAEGIGDTPKSFGLALVICRGLTDCDASSSQTIESGV